MKFFVFALVSILLSACASTTDMRFALNPEPNACQVTEARPTMLSTLAVAVCWDKEGRALGMAGGAGKSAASIPLDVVGIAATLVAPVLGAVVLGAAVRDVNLAPNVTTAAP